MNVIDIKNFKKSFGKKEVHRNVSFSVQEGECVGLIGGSGAGKSVLLRSLIGLEKPDSGEVFVEGENVAPYTEDQLIEIRKKVAYVFQNGALFDSMTVYENLAYPLREHTQLREEQISKRIHDLLDEFGLTANDHVYPADLSGGMQKRVGLARSIIINPKVVLYDEPTAGLDPFNTVKIQEMILRLKRKGTTSILVTHDMPTAFAVCDRIYLLKNGMVGAEGTIHDLKKDPEGLLSQFISGQGV
ncbi:MAG: ABC transporter ATP-binding protein [Bdellovibrionales bacterium]|nr:ABC transporter ATP-binding protein [Bdellovibrionales bacterium]